MIALGTYNLNYGASDEPKIRASHANRSLALPIQVSASVRSVDNNHVVSANSRDTSCVVDGVQNPHTKSLQKLPANSVIVEESKLSLTSTPSASKKAVTKNISSSNRSS